MNGDTKSQTMISSRVRDALVKDSVYFPKRDLHAALAKVVEAAELVTDEIAKSRSHSYDVESAGAKAFVALQGLERALGECGV